MALSTTCPKDGCTSTSFELKRVKVDKCNHYISFIQCKACGCAISAIDESIEQLTIEIAKKLGIRY